MNPRIVRAKEEIYISNIFVLAIILLVMFLLTSSFVISVFVFFFSAESVRTSSELLSSENHKKMSDEMIWTWDGGNFDLFKVCKGNHECDGDRPYCVPSSGGIFFCSGRKECETDLECLSLGQCLKTSCINWRCVIELEENCQCAMDSDCGIGEECVITDSPRGEFSKCVDPRVSAKVEVKELDLCYYLFSYTIKEENSEEGDSKNRENGYKVKKTLLEVKEGFECYFSDLSLPEADLLGLDKGFLNGTLVHPWFEDFKCLKKNKDGTLLPAVKGECLNKI
jgi:hypothetical protein